MTEPEPQYSDYLDLVANVNNMAAVFAGFIITIITLLLTQLQYPFLLLPSTQLILLFLGVLFHFWVFLVGVNLMGAFLTVRTLPPSVRTSSSSIPIFIIAYWAMGMAIPLLFLLWSMWLLAVITTIVWMLFFIVSLLAQYGPLQEFRKTRKEIQS